MTLTLGINIIWTILAALITVCDTLRYPHHLTPLGIPGYYFGAAACALWLVIWCRAWMAEQQYAAIYLGDSK